VTELSPEVDVVLVIGSKNSSNSQRLVDRAKEAGRPRT
jgi:4-hydroxy-3-methylbut-2-enyl diphosphate reductase IspH